MGERVLKGFAANASDLMTTDSPPGTSTTDTVQISGLRLTTRIGVPDEERESLQSVEAHIVMHPSRGSLAGLEDKIESTIDYYQVSQSIRKLAALGERHLIETLAEEIADLVLGEFPVQRVTVEIRKFILADADFVAVTVSKEKAA